LRFNISHIFRNNKNIAIISEFTVYHRTSCISTRWWWCLLCPWYMYKASNVLIDCYLKVSSISAICIFIIRTSLLTVRHVVEKWHLMRPFNGQFNGHKKDGRQFLGLKNLPCNGPPLKLVSSYCSLWVAASCPLHARSTALSEHLVRAIIYILS
jgi:hypothetical protein